ncbi:MAG: mechanosensitive ion channel family protein [Acidithiobacillales bacterium]
MWTTARVAVRALLLPALLAAGASAQPAPQTAPQTAATEVPAPVVFGGREIAIFRARVLGYSPQERAAAATIRIRSVLDAGGAGVASVRDVPEGKLLELDGKGVFALVPGDVEKLVGGSLEADAAHAKSVLALVATEDHERHDLPRLLVALAETIAATAAAWGLLVLLGRLRRWVGRTLDERVSRKLESVKLGGAEQFAREPVLYTLRVGYRVVAVLLQAALILVWTGVVLRLFPQTRAFGEHFARLLVDAVATVGSGLLASIPGLLVVIAIVIVTRLIAKGFAVFFRRVETGAIEVAWLEADLAAPTRRIVVAVVWIFALVMAYPYLPGSKSEAFKGVSVLLGLMVSLGATGAVGQAAAGMMLLYSRTLRTGEWVRIGEHEGIVTSVGMFATRLRTGFGEEIVLPNSVVVGTTTLNYSRLGGGRGVLVETGVTIGYGEPWRQVEALLLLAAGRTPEIRKDPAPFVVQKALSDFYIDYRLYAFTDEVAARLRVLGALHANVQDAFNEFGVQIMSPHYLGDPAHPAIVPKEKWHAAPARGPGAEPNV